MSVSVTFAGTAYSIPEDGEVGWSSLTDYLVALSNASVATTLKASVRTVTVTPSTAQATDCVLLCGTGASVIELPTGIRGQFYAVYDKQGTAKVSPLTINTAVGNTFETGLSAYSIQTNYGGVLLQYADSGNIWKIIAEIRDLYVQLPRIINDTTNPSFLPAAVEPLSDSYFLAGNLNTCSAQFLGSKTIEFIVSVNDNTLHVITDYARSTFTVLSDAANLYLETDAGTGIYMSKLANSPNITFKNRYGTAVPIEIRVLTNQLTNVTPWS